MQAIHEIRPRNLRFEFDATIPREWIADDIVGTHMANALNLLFPEGERFFIRSVSAAMDRVRDFELKKRAKAFMAQEVHHGREHERFFEALKTHGFDFEPFLDQYVRFCFEWLEPKFSTELKLAITAAVEHYTAAFAEDALTDWIPSGRAHPVIADLFRWHAAEEIEHKSVAYDVLQAVAPGYVRRVTGMAIASTILGAFWARGTLKLLKQDPEAKLRKIFRQLPRGGIVRAFRRRTMSRAFLRYLKPGFHPSQIPNQTLATEALQNLSQRYPAEAL